MRNAQFVSLTRASVLLGIDRARVRDLIKRGELVPFEDPLDRRRTLIAVSDLSRLHEPRPRAQSPRLAVA